MYEPMREGAIVDVGVVKLLVETSETLLDKLELVTTSKVLDDEFGGGLLYRFNLAWPPQYSLPFPAHVIVQPLEAGSEESRLSPQKHSCPYSTPKY
jgi:hypothetical protein